MRTSLPWLLPCLVHASLAAQTGTLPDRPLGVDDLISVSVHGAPELTRTVRVSPEGTMSLPLLRSAIPVVERTPAEVAESLRERLREEGLLVDPLVSITVAEYLSRPVTIVGAVRSPGSHQVQSRLTLLDLIARAGGFTESADSEILLTRPGEDATQTIPIRDLMAGVEPAANIPLFGGELIRVPEARRVFVLGNVRKPGSFPIQSRQPLTVLQAIALAEGLTPFYRPTVYILRRATDGPPGEIPVELARILRRELPDPPLRPEDTLYIPDAPGRRHTAQALDRAAGFSLATLSGLLVWRR